MSFFRTPMDTRLEEQIEIARAHLRTQFERGWVVLFTGAGFSTNAKNLDGELLPTGRSLCEMIWRLCFPSDHFDDSTTLQDVYQAALGKDPKGLRELLVRKLTVDRVSVDERIARYFFFPWHRIYTLNVDNLADAISRHIPLPRPLIEISATSPPPSRGINRAVYTPLPVYYLNGTLSDAPDNVTFSAQHYAKRQAFPDNLYQELVADIVSRPVIFVGTRLDESTLWQNIEIRRAKGSREMRELRPRSYLVTPKLDMAREARLSEFNITWIPMTAEEFSDEVLETLTDASKVGLQVFQTSLGDSSQSPRLPEVGELATEPHRPSGYLLGQEPIWADIQSGRAVERACDQEYGDRLQTALKEAGPRGILMILGTAGAGKSTCLMRLALRATAQGHHVAWVDRGNELSPREIISAMKQASSPSILAIDDADIFKSSLSPMILDIISLDKRPLIILSIRSGMVDRVIDSVVLEGIPLREAVVPHLADNDIDSLLDVLDKENRLGALKGKPRAEQFHMFQEYAGRQLLVAMLSATSGDKFHKKIPEEFFDLPYPMQRVYAVVALATTFRYRMTRHEVLIALNDSTNEALNTIDALIRRNIIVEMPPGSGLVQARHRVIAEVIRDELQMRGQISEAIFGLAFLAATYKQAAVPRKHRSIALLRSLTNHDFLYKNLGRESSQLLYQNLEDMLSGDPHFWLQRGSMEVEFGDLRLAENFLGQAKGLSPRDLYIDNEWAYMLFKKALLNPRSESASAYVEEATDITSSIILDPRATEHPFHVIGSQGLAWSRAGISVPEEKARYLSELKSIVGKGIERFPQNSRLRQLRDDLQREYLSLAVSPRHL